MIGLAPRFRTQHLATLLVALTLVLSFVSSGVMAQDSDGSGTGYVTLTGARLNVRSAPESTASIIGKLESGAVVTILGSSADGAWLRVRAATVPDEGWVSAAFVAVGTAPGVSSTPVSTIESSTTGGGAATVPSRGLTGAAAGAVLLPVATKAPATGAMPAATSAATTAATSVAALPTATPNSSGGSFTLPTATPAASSAAADAPTATAAAPTTVAAAPTEAVTEAVTEAAPETSTEVVSDAMASDAETESAGGIGDPIAQTRPANMNLRGGPGTNYGVVGTATAGTILYITGVTEAGDWYRVNRADSTEAWVSASLVTTSGAVDGIAVLGGDEIPAPPVAAAPNTSASASTNVATTSAVASSVNAPAPAGFGEFGYGVTASMWQSEKSSVANSIQNMGFNWVKQQVRWEFVEESPGAVNWQEMDAIVNTMNGYGINVAFSVVTSPAWTRPNWGGTGGPPEDFQLAANFMGAIAGRYCGQSLKAIEVWNEQNLQREWMGLPLSAASYMDLLKRSYASIKAACPSMLVISGATTPAGNSDVAIDDIDYLRQMYEHGLKNYSDGIGIHPSGFANPPGVRYSDWAGGGYNAESHVNHRSFYFLSTLEESRAVMVQYGDTAKRLWPTEFGWGSSPQPYPGYEYQRRVTEQQQADWSVQAYQIMANSGYVGVAFLWNLNYNHGEMQTFAIVGRPAYDALRAMMGR